MSRGCHQMGMCPFWKYQGGTERGENSTLKFNSKEEIIQLLILWWLV